MPRRLAKADELVGGGADLGDRAGGAVDVVGPHGLDRVDDRERRALGLERGQDVAQVGLGGEPQRRVGEAEAAGAHADLRGGLLAGDVDRRPRRGAAKAAAACRSSVDLPMPGSPPTRMAEAGTSPPPSTRSSSAMPLRARGERRLGGGEVAER